MKRLIIVSFIAILVFSLTACGEKVDDKDGMTYVQDISYDSPVWDVVEDADDVDIAYSTDGGFELKVSAEKDGSVERETVTLESFAADNNGNVYAGTIEVDGQEFPLLEVIYDNHDGSTGNMHVALIEHDGYLYKIEMLYMDMFDSDGDYLDDYREFKGFVEDIELN